MKRSFEKQKQEKIKPKNHFKIVNGQLISIQSSTIDSEENKENVDKEEKIKKKQGSKKKKEKVPSKKQVRKQISKQKISLSEIPQHVKRIKFQNNNKPFSSDNQ
ncbi:hypothetical protein ABK040_010105 [Willaertia magna]